MSSNLSEEQIEVIKTCAKIIAKKYDEYEPWISPNSILGHFKLPLWELADDSWYDPETAVSHFFR